MSEPIRLSFSGEFDLDWLNLEGQQSRVLESLQGDSYRMAAEVSKRIQESIGVDAPDVTIHFAEGSIRWFGIVQWVHDAWPIIEIMSTVGGAISLLQVVRDSIDGVLRRRFSALDSRTFPFYSPSAVLIISGPNSVRGGIRSTIHLILLGTAAIIASIAAFVAALGYFMRTVAR